MEKYETAYILKQYSWNPREEYMHVKEMKTVDKSLWDNYRHRGQPERRP